MSTKEKNETKDDIFVISILLFANIFYALPIAIIASGAVKMEHLIYIIFPVLISVISVMYGYKCGKDYKLSVIMYILLMPAFTLLKTKGDIIASISFFFIVAFCYFTLSILAINFGDFNKNIQDKQLNKNKNKKTVNSKPKVMAKKKK